MSNDNQNTEPKPNAPEQQSGAVLAAPTGSADTSKCQRCQTPLVRAVEAGLCAHCCDHLVKIEPSLKKQNQLLREIIKDHTRQWSKAKQWREIAEALIEYSNPRATKGAEYTATVQRANALRPPNRALWAAGVFQDRSDCGTRRARR